MREGIAQRAQAIAIQLRADKLAIRENQSGGAAPGFALLRKGRQCAAHVARKQRIFFKGRRNHGEHGFIRGQALEEPKLETVVETGGIADIFFEKREPRSYRELRADFGGFGAQPAAVRDNRIDLSVMRDVAEGLREMPGRLRVGGIALVKNGKCGCERRIAQVFVELRKLPGREQALVDDGLRRERADVTARGHEGFGAFSEERQTPLEAGGSASRMEGFDEELPNFGHGFQRAAAQRIGVHGHAAPSDDAKTLGVRGGFNGGASFVDDRRRKKSEADGKHFWQRNSLLLSARAEEGLWERSEQTGAVAAGAVGVDTSAVGEAFQRGQSKLDNVVAGGTTEAGDEASTAGVVVRVAPVGMMKLSLRQTGSGILADAMVSTVPEVHTSLSNGWGVVVQRRILIL